MSLVTLTPKEKITRVKIAMQEEDPFFSYILLNLNFIEDEDGRYFPPDNRTMAVDNHGNIYWTPEFVEKLDEQELRGVLVHEVLHICLRHLDRTGSRNRKLFNVANDILVNYYALKQGYRLPKGGIMPNTYDHTFEFTTNKGTKKHTIKGLDYKSSEEVYEEIYKILKEAKKDKGGGSDGVPGNQGGSPDNGDDVVDIEMVDGHQPFDEHIYGDGEQPKDEEDESGGRGRRKIRISPDDLNRIVSEAANHAKRQGKLPVGMERLVENLLDSQINWKEKLYKYIVSQIPFDFSWSLPSKKSAALGIYLPRPVKESVQLLFHVDTSGSMREEELAQALGEMQSILSVFSNVKIDVLVGDAEIQNAFTLTNENVDDILEFSKELKGGGGTDHQHVFEYVEENYEDAKILICFTDGYTSFPENPDFMFDTLWVLTSDGIAEQDVPFGDVIKVERNGRD